jgi:hypothetical protein
MPYPSLPLFPLTKLRLIVESKKLNRAFVTNKIHRLVDNRQYEAIKARKSRLFLALFVGNWGACRILWLLPYQEILEISG